MQYRFYDPKLFAEGDAVLDFCQLLGIAEHRNTGVNQADGLNQLALYYAYQRCGAEQPALPNYLQGRALLRRKLARLPFVRFRIAPARLRAMLATYADDCAWMQARLPEFEATQGLEPRSGIYELSDLEELIDIAREIEPAFMSLIPWFTPDANDATTRIGTAMAAIEAVGRTDQTAIRDRVHQIHQKLEQKAKPEDLVAAVIDVPFYAAQAGVRFADKATAAMHYLTTGWHAQLNPAPWFSDTAYCEEYPDVRAANLPPFVHYLSHGYQERRLVRPSQYKAQNAF